MTDPVIAVIDNDSSFLASINETLAQSGYIAILSQGDSDARHLIERERPSLIIIDGSLCESEREDDVVGNLISSAVAHRIPMLMTTPRREETLDGDTWRAYRCASLAKPIDPEELQLKLSEALGPMALLAGYR